jgi:pyruvate-formate lyase-activating enzyme
MIDTDATSDQLRQASIDLARQALLISRLSGTDQESDLSDPTNCGGLGRIRHFHAETPHPWPANPLPWLPARNYLGSDRVPDGYARAQVFQNAACNWRCWYCYVPFTLLRADPAKSEWVTAERLVEEYLALPDRPPILDLSGGQPGLVPEWAPWTLRALRDRGADVDTFVWSDDNLSNDYLFRYLSDDDLALLADHPGYGRVGCLKGFDPESFAFNTGADPALFERQFDILKRVYDLKPTVWVYVTLTSPTMPTDPRAAIESLTERLARIHPDLIQRTVPLQIQRFTPMLARMRVAHEESLVVQETLAQAWTDVVGNIASNDTRPRAHLS